MTLKDFNNRVKFHFSKGDFLKTSILRVEYELSKIYRPVLSTFGNPFFIAVRG